MNPTLHQASFSPETDEIPNYQPPNRVAFVALAVALLSPVALLHPLLAFVALGAAVLAAIALWISHYQQTGRTVALVALVLAIVFGTMGPTRYLTRQFKLFRDARIFADEWLEIIDQGDLEQAHQLAETYFDREPADVSLTEFYSNPLEDFKGIPTEEQINSPFMVMRGYFAEDPLSTILSWPDGFEATFESNAHADRGTAASETVRIVYACNEKGNSSPASVRIGITMQRYVQGQMAYWRVFEFDDPDVVHRQLGRKIIYHVPQPQ
jgi:hypothetical protein